MEVSEKIDILIIDDEADFCEIISAFFRRQGYETSFAHSLKEGLRLLKKIKPKILFLDNHLPDGRGWEHALKLSTSYPGMIINLISAINDESTFLVPLDTRVRIMVKPLSMNKIESYLSF